MKCFVSLVCLLVKGLQQSCVKGVGCVGNRRGTRNDIKVNKQDRNKKIIDRAIAVGVSMAPHPLGSISPQHFFLTIGKKTTDVKSLR